METVTIRNKLHQLIDTMDEKKVKAVYSLFKKSIEDTEFEDYSPEFKAELDRRYAAYKKDRKVISRECMNKRIKEILTEQNNT